MRLRIQGISKTAMWLPQDGSAIRSGICIACDMIRASSTRTGPFRSC
jgi:hypothetical protein